MPTTLSIPDAYRTIGQLSRELGIPQHTLRRMADALGIAERVYLYRLVPLHKLPLLTQELRRRGYAIPELGTSEASHDS